LCTLAVIGIGFFCGQLVYGKKDILKKASNDDSFLQGQAFLEEQTIQGVAGVSKITLKRESTELFHNGF